MSALTQTRLYIFTSSYPYSGRQEQPFVGPQLEHLAEEFEIIIIVPYYIEGIPWPLPDGIIIDHTLSRLRKGRFFNLSSWLSVLSNRTVFRELCGHPSCFMQILKYALLVETTKQWAGKVEFPAVCYTMFLGAITVGLGKGRDRGAPIRVVSRCIGGDVNEGQYSSRYIPFKRTAIEAVDHLFPCSQVMEKMLKKQYPDVPGGGIETSRMGVPEAGFTVNPSQDGVRRIVSCGRVIPIKRYDLLAKSITRLASDYPAVCFEWRHIPLGDTSGLRIELSRAEAYSNLDVIMEDESISVMDIYRNNPADLFVHTSRSEGLPFVIMEALSCGLPVVATDAGGVSELVDSSVGRLLPNEIKPKELASNLWELLENRDLLGEKKSAAKDRWRHLVNSGNNYSEFSRKLVDVGNELPGETH